MTSVLISIVAVAFAVFFAVLAWRLRRDEQARSAARVAALSAAIDEAAPVEPRAPIGVAADFLAHERPGGGGHALLKLAIGFAIVVAGIVAVASLGTPRPDPAAAAASGPATDASLELLSMRYAREGDTLGVTGLVRNSGRGSARGVIAVVVAFDRSGNFVASGRAPIEFVTLGPGDESPFRVSVPNAGSVGRYRVSFRTEAGTLRHTDRRQALVASGSTDGRRPAR